MEMDLRALSDEELAPAVARAVNELQWRLDSESERARRTKLELLARGIKRGWTGYAAVRQQDANTRHIMQPDGDGAIVDVWVRWPTH